jgi:hypothetical protein
MATKKKQTNGKSDSNGHAETRLVSGDKVTISREEFDAWTELEIANVKLRALVDTMEKRKHEVAHKELTSVHEFQGKRLTEAELTIAHLKQITGLQKVYIDQLRDGTKVPAIEDMVDFWNRWTISANNLIQKTPTAQSEVAKYEPDLFKTWRNWIKDAGRVDRVLSEAGSREEYEKQQPKTMVEMQEHLIMRLRMENHELSTRIKKVEAEAEEHKKGKQEAKTP